MNNKQAKRLRKHIRSILPDARMATPVYDTIEHKPRNFYYPPGTRIPDAPGIHVVMTPPLPDGKPSPVIVQVDREQRVLGMCHRKFYQQLKRDVKRARAGGSLV
jgi:hypothetical protein